MNVKNLINTSLSNETHHCEGAFVASQTGSYFLGFNYAVAKVNKQFSHTGSSKLDEINAFDRAEITRAYLGQVNAIQVSSFCGPKGVIWGLDLCKVPMRANPWGISADEVQQAGLDIWDMEPLVAAYARLTGSVQQARFPFMPGAHIPIAMKSITREGPGALYVAHGCGIPEDRSQNACVLMEDIGLLPEADQNRQQTLRDILLKLCQSVLAIGVNQGVRYRSLLIGIDSIDIGSGEVGCALAASPYFTLAQAACPKGVNMEQISLAEWEAMVADRFLYRASVRAAS
jgi:histidine decarboxylase